MVSALSAMAEYAAGPAHTRCSATRVSGRARAGVRGAHVERHHAHVLAVRRVAPVRPVRRADEDPAIRERADAALARRACGARHGLRRAPAEAAIVAEAVQRRHGRGK